MLLVINKKSRNYHLILETTEVVRNWWWILGLSEVSFILGVENGKSNDSKLEQY